MANSAQARKRARQANVRRERNMGQRSMYRTEIKKLEAAIEAGNKDQATELFRSASKNLDRVASKGLIHKNKAARLKSRLSKRVSALS